MTEWFENEEFWAAVYPYMFPNDRFERAEEQVENILQLTEFQGESVLDLCCGPGRHSVLLAKRGIQVTAVDITPFLLKKAREMAVAENVKVEWVQNDMREFVRDVSYDLVLSMFTSFGYFKKEDDNLKVLRNIYQSLKPGGSCLIDVVSKEWLAKVFQPTSSSDEEDGTILVQRREVVKDWSRIKTEWILIKDGETRTFAFEHSIYSGQELKDRLAQTGFKNIKLYGSLEGEEYGVNSKRLIAAAQKPK